MRQLEEYVQFGKPEVVHLILPRTESSQGTVYAVQFVLAVYSNPQRSLPRCLAAEGSVVGAAFTPRELAQIEKSSGFWTMFGGEILNSPWNSVSMLYPLQNGLPDPEACDWVQRLIAFPNYLFCF